jgi:hypothetical protein
MPGVGADPERQAAWVRGFISSVREVPTLYQLRSLIGMTVRFLRAAPGSVRYAPGRVRSDRVDRALQVVHQRGAHLPGDEANLDITWLKFESLDDRDKLPARKTIAVDADLTAALAQFEVVASALETSASAPRADPDFHAASTTSSGHVDRW